VRLEVGKNFRIRVDDPSIADSEDFLFFFSGAFGGFYLRDAHVK